MKYEQIMDPTMFIHVNNANKPPVHLEFESLPSEATIYWGTMMSDDMLENNLVFMWPECLILIGC
jgi:hypothetical protein